MSWNRDRIVDWLLEAGAVAREAKKNLRREIKNDQSIVTQADREIEAFFTERFEDESAGVRIIGEETIAQKGEDYVSSALRGKAFVVDPIDGTAPFAHYLPNWGVSVGYMEDGRLVDGAIYLPEYGEIVLSNGDAVEEGCRNDDGSWSWRELPVPEKPNGVNGLIAITQQLAKRGGCSLPNNVMALGAAVVPLAGLAQGRFLSYIGRVKLWDAAGGLPLLRRLGFSMSIEVDGATRVVSDVVYNSIFCLEPGHPSRWFFRGSLSICYAGDEDRMRRGLSEEGLIDD